MQKKRIKLKKKIYLVEIIYHVFLMSRDVGSKFLDGICKTLNLNCANLMSFFTGALHFTNDEEISLNFYVSNSLYFHNYLFYFGISFLLLNFIGPNCCINASRIDIYLDHEPQPTSTKNLIHFSQSKSTS